MTNKKKEITIHSSAAEYLTYVPLEAPNWQSMQQQADMKELSFLDCVPISV